MKAILYIHGKGGSHLEAEHYKKNCDGFDIIGVDYNGYLPWLVQNQIKAEYDSLMEKYDGIFLIANSIGAYFSMLTLQNRRYKKGFVYIACIGHGKSYLRYDVMGKCNRNRIAQKRRNPN